MARRTFLIVGGGIIGLAAAYKILLAHPEATVTVLEKEGNVGRHQSSNNSGVLHAGLYYRVGSNKARMAVSGIRQMIAFCQKNDIPHEVCGKVVVAVDEGEIPALRQLFERGRKNGLVGLEWLGPSQIKETEPYAGGIAGVRVPEEGIVDFPRVCASLSDQIEKLGGRVITGANVRALERVREVWVAKTDAGEFTGDVLVNCAGLHCDRIAKIAGERSKVRIVPFRGEYYLLRADRQFLVKHLIYPVPDPAFPFLGVHFTRRIGGGVEAGPNAVLAFAREGYRKTTVNMRDAVDALTFPGLWRFASRHARVCWAELRRSTSRKLFCKALQRLVPAITEDDLVPGGSGVRAQAMLPTGQLVGDFMFLERRSSLHVLNAPSPGATASLSIGDEIVRRVGSIMA